MQNANPNRIIARDDEADVAHGYARYVPFFPTAIVTELDGSTKLGQCANIQHTC